MNFAEPHSELCIVIDNGTYKTRVGFGGNSYPSFELPPIVKHEDSYNADIMPVYQSKNTRSYSNLEHFYNSILLDHLKIEPSDQSYLLTEPVFESQQNRLQMLEMMFETFCAQKVALATDSILSLYSLKSNPNVASSLPYSSHLTGLIVDLGHMQSTIVPIVEGHIIENGIVRYKVTGETIRNQIKSSILEINKNSAINYLSDHELNTLCDVIKEKFGKIITMEGKPRLAKEQISVEFSRQVK
jgi:actin-related protein